MFLGFRQPPLAIKYFFSVHLSDTGDKDVYWQYYIQKAKPRQDTHHIYFLILIHILGIATGLKTLS